MKQIFKIEIDCASMADETQLRFDLPAYIEVVADRVATGMTNGIIRDTEGNIIGNFKTEYSR